MKLEYNKEISKYFMLRININYEDGYEAVANSYRDDIINLLFSIKVIKEKKVRDKIYTYTLPFPDCCSNIINGKVTFNYSDASELLLILCKLDMLINTSEFVMEHVFLGFSYELLKSGNGSCMYIIYNVPFTDKLEFIKLKHKIFNKIYNFLTILPKLNRNNINELSIVKVKNGVNIPMNIRYAYYNDYECELINNFIMTIKKD